MLSIYTNFDKALAYPENVKVLHLVKQKGVKKRLKQIPSLVNLEEFYLNKQWMETLPESIGN